MRSAAGGPRAVGSIFSRDGIAIEIDGMLNATCNTGPSSRTILYMKLNFVLKKLLEAKGESARKAAKGCGVPLSTFTGYLKPGRKQVDPTHLISISKYFKVSVDSLLGLEQKSPKLDGLPTKKLFSRWVKLTIEDIAEIEEEK
jgi:hypothetical protein